MSSDPGTPEQVRMYDAFMFHDELDVLDIRLHELRSVVDRFVIVEATITHSGRPKELVFPKHRARYRQFEDKILYEAIASNETVLAPHESPWQRERAQRDHIHPFLLSQGARSDDILIVSDVDEIPRASVIQRYRMSDGLRKLDMGLYYYYLDLQVAPSGWAGSFIIPVGHVTTNLSNIRVMEAPRIERAGWHFSYLGGIQQVKTKLQSFAHTELNQPHFVDDEHISRCFLEQTDLFGRGGQFVLVEDLSSLPACVANSPDKFRSLLCASNQQTA